MSQEEQQSAVPLREQVQRLTFVFDCFPTPPALLLLLLSPSLLLLVQISAPGAAVLRSCAV